VCLIARHLEANGIPTLCLGSAFDILEAGKPPRAVFLDYPLGHSAGKPFDLADQESVIEQALAGFESLKSPGEMITLENKWGDSSWRAEASSTDGDDTRQPRDTTPQFQFESDRSAAIAKKSSYNRNKRS
jgi:hypothetical protein